MPGEPNGNGDQSPYAGRWVARVHGQVVAHGGTADQARQAAGISRYKEMPDISFVPPLVPLSFAEVVDRVLPHVGGAEIFLVGGAVRDALMGRVSHDFDFAVPRQATELARQVARGLQADFYVLDRDFDAARVIVKSDSGPPDVLDFVAFRGGDLDTDLAGRDFTINAIAYEPRERTLHDPLGGGADLRLKLIRACSESSLHDDPVRVLRAVRQAAAFGFKIDPQTRQLMKDASSQLPAVSPERQRDELFRILDGPRPEAALKALDMLGAMPFFLPELSGMHGVSQSPPHVHDVWEHTLSVIGHLGVILAVLGPDSDAARNSDVFSGFIAVRLGRYRQELAKHFAETLAQDRSLRSLLFFGALFHDVSKPATRSLDEDGRIRFLGHELEGSAVVGERAATYNLSNDETSRLKSLVSNHMRFNHLVQRMLSPQEAPSRKAIYRFFRAAGDCGPDLVILGLADQWGTRGPTLDQTSWEAAVDVARLLLENYYERPQESVAPPRLLDGNEVMRLYGISAGPSVGAVLEAIREGQATGEVVDRNTAIEFGRRWITEHPV